MDVGRIFMHFRLLLQERIHLEVYNWQSMFYGKFIISHFNRKSWTAERSFLKTFFIYLAKFQNDLLLSLHKQPFITAHLSHHCTLKHAMTTGNP